MDKKELRYRLSSIDSVTLVITPKDQDFTIEQDDILFKVSLKLNWRHEEEIISNTCNISFLDKRQNNEQLMNIIMTCSYKIKDFSNHIIRVKDTTTVPDTFLMKMFSDTVNTAGGYIYAKLENTYLEGMFLGTFDSYTMVDSLKKRGLLSRT
jgi:hypothetical protein